MIWGCFGLELVLSFFGDAVRQECDSDENDDVEQDADGVIVAVELPAAERGSVDDCYGVGGRQFSASQNGGSSRGWRWVQRWAAPLA